MRIRALCLSLAVLILAATQTSTAHAQAGPASRGSVLSGMIQSPICWSDNFASGQAAGDLNGSFFVAFDCTDGSISGGTWLIVVTAENADGTIEVRGTLRGQVRRGAFESDETGRHVALRDVSLAVTEGTGEYEAVSQGSGSLEATADPQGAPQFAGTIALTF